MLNSTLFVFNIYTVIFPKNKGQQKQLVYVTTIHLTHKSDEKYG